MAARVDSQTVKLYFRGELIKVHQRLDPVAGRPIRRTCRRN
ncbi:hypothetical protein ACFZC5_08925 [Nocardia gamkensis]